jgi:hypothetical protein
VSIISHQKTCLRGGRRLRAEMISGTLVACLFIGFIVFYLQILIVNAARGE